MIPSILCLVVFLATHFIASSCRIVKIESALTHPLWPSVEQLKRKYASKEHYYRIWSPQIANFDKYVSHLSSCRGMIILDTFGRNIPTSSSQNPVILRNLALLAIPAFQDIIWGPGSLASKNVTVSGSSKLKCPTSKYFSDFILNKIPNSDSHASIPAFCFHLDLFKISKHSKNWSCLIQIGLFTHQYTDYIEMVSQEDVPPHKLSFPQVWPPTVSLFVDIGSTHLYYSGPESFCNSPRLFLLFELSVEKLRKFYSINVTSQQASVSTIKLLNSCPADAESKGALENVNLNDNLLRNLNMLQMLVLPSTTRKIIWNFAYNDLTGDSVFIHMIRTVLNCDRSTKVSGSPEERVGAAYANIWFSIMKNYTTVQLIGSACENGIEKVYDPKTLYLKPSIKFVLSSYVKGFHYFPYFTRDHLADLRFVSCGPARGYRPIPFEQLTNIFDKWIWILLFLSCLSEALLLRIQAQSGRKYVISWSNLTSALKVFLEQGDSVIQKKSFRAASGLFILIGIVLSNAYKSTNVYNMISPRKPIPYEFFHELVTDNFSIYTRVISVETDIFNFIGQDDDILAVFKTRGGSVAGLKRDELEVIIISEVAQVAGSILHGLEMTQAYHANVSETVALEQSNIVKLGVRNISQLHPNTKLMLEVIHKRIQSKMTEFDDEMDITEYMRSFADTAEEEEKKLRIFDTETLEKSLLICNRTAIVMPHHLCQDFMRNVRRKLKLPHLFVGKESYSEVEWMFTLEGVLPPHIPRRIKGAHEAGLWERGPMLASSKETATDDAEAVVAAATMEGNVVVVFAVWVLGMILSVWSMIVEFSCTSVCPIIVTKLLWNAMQHYLRA